jgi:hypothetical protein
MSIENISKSLIGSKLIIMGCPFQIDQNPIGILRAKPIVGLCRITSLVDSKLRIVPCFSPRRELSAPKSGVSPPPASVVKKETSFLSTDIYLVI